MTYHNISNYTVQLNYNWVFFFFAYYIFEKNLD